MPAQIPVLFSYLMRRYCAALALVALGFSLIIYLIEVTELFRRTADKQASVFEVLYMALLKLPTILLELLPIFILLAGFKVFYQRLELTVMRAAGQSVWQQLKPLMVVGALLGVLAMMIIQPVAIQGQQVFNAMEERIIGQRSANTQNPLRITQPNKIGGRTIILATDIRGQQRVGAVNAVVNQATLSNVTILTFDQQNRQLSRFNASQGYLTKGCWYFPHITKLSSGLEGGKLQVTILTNHCIETDITLLDVWEMAENSDIISFWKLPHFIKRQFAAGYTAARYQLQWHLIMALPFLFISMILLAAVFTLKPNSRKNIWGSIFMGAVAGFLLYFGRNIITAMGMSGKLPVLLAAYAPIAIIMLFSTGRLMQRED